GKTVTLQVLAETFSQAGVPCFMADMKGDLSGVSQAGAMSGFIEKRCAEFGIENPDFHGSPVRFYDVFGEQGHPMRTTISNMGPQLLARLMGLNDVQTGVLNIVFKVADDKGLLLIDMKDLRAMLAYVSDHSKEYSATYGNVTPTSIGTIQRALLELDSQGAELFFAEPSFDIFDLFQTENGKGVLSVLAADKLMLNPKLYSTFLLWLLSDIYCRLPEVGDLELPRLVFFFDEAHTLFDDTPKALVDKIEQVVRLIRSKGVGVYFVTQNPSDIPDSILGQLGNRVQHALRAYTPKDQKAVRAAAETFRTNPNFKTEEAIMELATGEALVSFLDEKGAPSVVQRARILFPLSQIGAVTPDQRKQIIRSSMVYGKYDTTVDRQSAFEDLIKMNEQEQARVQEAQAKAVEKQSKESKKKSGVGGALLASVLGTAITAVSSSIGTEASRAVTGKKVTGKTIADRAIKNTTSAVTRNVTKSLTRSLLGNLMNK
ncbi:MAG: DUF853 family protein, partial [Bacteroidales bacterium]|nr:DUF853 family protein [Bacteroidales bacterium]